MKHSNPVKFPVKFMIVALSLSLVLILLFGYFILRANSDSQQPKEFSDGNVVVEQLNLSSFNQALDNISN